MEISPALLAAMLAAVVGGFVRGFAGFGGALIFSPVAGAVLGPQIAAPLFFLMDYCLTVPIVFRSLRICDWPTVLPAALAGLITAPIGAWLLATGDPIVLRWAICSLVVLLLALIVSGWRYTGTPRPGISAAVGGVAGIFGGIGQVSGPPVIAFWMSGPQPVITIRANMFAFFGILGLSSSVAYFFAGLFTFEVLKDLVFVAPLYAGALLTGGWMFRRTNGANYRPLAYVLVAVAAVSSMPAFDELLR